jgi:DNA-binding PadR family transcriptional regulator
MSVKHILLGILSEKPRHGYDIKQAFDEKVGDFWALNYGQVYTTLERLRSDGLVECREVEQEGRPDKKIYRATAAGLRAFEAWLREPVRPGPRALRDDLFFKLVFTPESGAGQILEMVQSRHGVYLAYMMQLTNRKVQIERRTRQALKEAATPPARRRIEHERAVSLLLIDAALQHAEADIRWLRQCETRIRSLAREP